MLNRSKFIALNDHYHVIINQIIHTNYYFVAFARYLFLFFSIWMAYAFFIFYFFNFFIIFIFYLFSSTLRASLMVESLNLITKIVCNPINYIANAEDDLIKTSKRC
jgi:hypothetical protein